MPSAPEVGYGHRLIRIAEVFGEFEAEHSAKADGHIRIAGKVKVYLEGIRYRARPRHKRGNIAAERVDIRPHRAHLVCKQHLFAETDHEAHNALGEIGRCDAAVGKLILNIGITHDGACYELGEHGDVHAEVDEIFLHSDIVAINVDGVAHCLEGVKRDAYRQSDIEKIKVCAEYCVYVRYDKVGVFKHAQQADIYDDRQNEHKLQALFVFAVLIHEAAENVVDQNGEYHQENVLRLAPSVEHKADYQQKQVSPLFRADIVPQQNKGQINAQEYRTAENHVCLSVYLVNSLNAVSAFCGASLIMSRTQSPSFFTTALSARCTCSGS